MPLFRYICNKCGNDFEVLQSHADEQVGCPKCGSADNARQLNRIGGIRNSGPIGCAARSECPSAGGHECCGGCCHHHHH